MTYTGKLTAQQVADSGGPAHDLTDEDPADRHAALCRVWTSHDPCDCGQDAFWVGVAAMLERFEKFAPRPVDDNREAS